MERLRRVTAPFSLGGLGRTKSTFAGQSRDKPLCTSEGRLTTRTKFLSLWTSQHRHIEQSGYQTPAEDWLLRRKLL